jgi:tight adherence protein B
VESMLLPILVAAAVMLLIFAATRVVSALTDAEKRKLKSRLSAEIGVRPGDGERRAITVQRETNLLSSLLVRIDFFSKLDRMLVHAYPETSLTRFLSIAGAIGAVLLLITLLLSGSLVFGVIAGAIGLYIPFLVLGQKRSKRQKMLAEQLPEALDFLGRVLKAGHSLSTGIQMMGEELNQPLGGEFRRAYDQHSLGHPMEDCLKEMASRSSSTDFAFFITAVMIQRQTGGDLTEVLGKISGLVRQRINLQQHVVAKTAEGRFTGYILAGFPVLMFLIEYVMNPKDAGMLLNTTSGLALLGTAVGLQLTGLYLIRRITTVTV